ncbi:helix-turn-helix transcriptional regulator [Halococcus saccharolyticus]|uniref:helix-turn-helix transcriptional regulator n=1 Tax=Halococcus saccharolyticus TaxID=62319 RepID=UPI0012673D73|nr:helix-turn-helix domain-containing protein [Halococcus saccharolyticus]
MTTVYGPNVGGAAIHKVMDLPCSDEGTCPYQLAWDFEPANYDVLVGHYVHANVPSAVENRTIVIDEFAEEAAVTTFHDPEPVVSAFVSRRRGLPFDDWTDFVEHRHERRPEAVRWFVRNYRDKNPDSWDVIDDDGDVHGLAGELVLGLLFAEDLGNGFRTTEKTIPKPTPDGWQRMALRDTSVRRRMSPKVAWNTEKNAVHLLSVPNFDDANGVAALDGTPTKRMWDTAFGVSFDHERVVPPSRMNDYLTDALDIKVHQYGAHDPDKAGTRPYSSGNHLYAETDEKLLHGIGMHFDADPDVITTRAAIREYDEDDRVLHHADEYRNFASVKSSNAFRESTVGAVLGSPHPGDETFKRWGAFMGSAIEGSGKGVDRSYRAVGDEIYHHYVHNQVLQSILRFGRDGQEAHVLVTSMCTPSWVEPEPLKMMTFSGSSSRAVVDCLRDSDGMSQSEIVDETGLSQQAASKALNGLDENGFVAVEDKPGPYSSQYVWN